MEELFLQIVLLVLGAGVIGLIGKKIKDLITAKVRKTETKIDDAVLDALGDHLDKLLLLGEDKAKELLEKKLEEVRKKKALKENGTDNNA